MNPKAKEIYDRVMANAKKRQQDPELLKIKEEMKDQLEKTGRIDPDLMAKALGAKPLSEIADKAVLRRLN